MLNLLWVGIVWAVATMGSISYHEKEVAKKEVSKDLSFDCVYRGADGKRFWYSKTEKRFFECKEK